MAIARFERCQGLRFSLGQDDLSDVHDSLVHWGQQPGPWEIGYRHWVCGCDL